MTAVRTGRPHLPARREQARPSTAGSGAPGTAACMIQVADPVFSQPSAVHDEAPPYVPRPAGACHLRASGLLPDPAYTTPILYTGAGWPSPRRPLSASGALRHVRAPWTAHYRYRTIRYHRVNGPGAGVSELDQTNPSDASRLRLGCDGAGDDHASGRQTPRCMHPGRRRGGGYESMQVVMDGVFPPPAASRAAARFRRGTHGC
jgi:hypothetical protein